MKRIKTEECKEGMKNCGNSTGSHNYKHSFKLIFSPKTKRAIFLRSIVKKQQYITKIFLHWLGGSIGWSTIPNSKRWWVCFQSGTYLICGFDPQSGLVYEATNRCFSTILMSLSLIHKSIIKHILG